MRTMSRNYEFTYPEQVMIYAQRPNATFCKPYEDWNAENYRRYVKRGSTGIALFVMNRDKPYLRYVFDVADTGVRRSSPELKPWEVTPENRSYEAGIEDVGTAGAVRCKSDLRSWKSAYKCCVLCDGYTVFGYWRLCDLLHCKGFVAVLAYSCGSWNCDNSSGVPARLGCYESREYYRKFGSIYQVVRNY